MKSILYLMHIPWGWIKQRPHFFAEYLSSTYIVDVCYRKSNTVSSSKLLTSKRVDLPNLRLTGFNNFPFNKIQLLKYFNLDWLNTLIAFLQLPSFRQYDYIWITSPILYPVVKPMIRSGQKIIYDCMDDMVEFPDVKNNNSLRRFILNREKELLEAADCVFVSSNYLQTKILTRANLNIANIHVVNNAIELPQEEGSMVLPEEIRNRVDYVKSLSFPFMYVGMLSEWFDFELIKSALNRYPQMNIVLLGPNDVQIPQHERIHYLGTVERKYIFPLMKEAFALIMPFLLNELIYSVNPVKLYEYIYTGKPVISVRYGETDKFAGYVHLYDNRESFLEIVDMLFKGCAGCKSREEINKYIGENTWRARYEQIVNVLES